MPQLFSCVYHAPSQAERVKQQVNTTNPVVNAFYAATTISSFPLDIGDDPAFFSAQYFKSEITWGICRPDVRGQLNIDDYVTFFSVETNGTTKIYSFVAALRVKELLSHTGIWNLPQKYKDYLNLLVRPHNGGWEHFEPIANLQYWHSDWMWRMCRRKDLGKKKEAENSSHQHISGSQLIHLKKPLPIANNYVVFDSQNALLLQQPVPVAIYSEGSDVECWNNDNISQNIRTTIFGNNPTRGLRTKNKQQPHRHFRRELETGTNEFIDSLRANLTAS